VVSQEGRYNEGRDSFCEEGIDECVVKVNAFLVDGIVFAAEWDNPRP